VLADSGIKNSDRSDASYVPGQSRQGVRGITFQCKLY
jgi:hypothetical protein